MYISLSLSIYIYIIYLPTPPRGRAPEKQGYCEFGGFPVSQVLEPLGADSLTFFPILPYLTHSLGDASEVLEDSQPLGAHSLAFFPILPYPNAFLRWRLASWLWGSLFRRFWKFRSLWILTVSHFLPYLNAFLRWRLASWLWGSLFRKFWRIRSLWGGSQSHFLPYSSLSYTAFLRWHLASWLWGSLSRRFWKFRSLWGLTVSLSSLFIPTFMHSLGDVWHPGSGVPCFGGFGSFAAFGGSQSHFLPYFSLS